MNHNKFYYDHLNKLMSQLYSGNARDIIKFFDSIADKFQQDFQNSKIIAPLALYQVSIVNEVKSSLAYNIGHNLLIFHQWQKSKQILLFNPDLTQALLETPIDDKLPVNLLESLPFHCFYVATPLLFFLGNQYGFFAYLNSTSEDYYSLHIVLDYGDKNLTPIIIPLLPSIKESIDEAIKKINSNQEVYRKELVVGKEEEFREAYYECIKLGLSHIYYLLSTSADITGRKENKEPSRENKAPKSPKHPQIKEVGFSVSKYLSKISSSKTLQNTRSKKSSHLRRAHWHTYKVGPGRSKELVKWIAPTVVNSEQEFNQVSIKKVD